MRFAEAQRYTGNEGEAWEAVGQAQLAILRAAGCRPAHRVLELGAGSLCGAHAVLAYLDAGGYVGIEPNGWLVRAALEDVPGLAELARAKRATWIERDDFDAEPSGPFHFVLSHSILSHAAHWQLVQMLVALRTVLVEGAQVIASIRLREHSSFDAGWQYPGNSSFALEDVELLAAACGYRVQVQANFRAIVVAAAPNNVHDWLVFRRWR